MKVKSLLIVSLIAVMSSCNKEVDTVDSVVADYVFSVKAENVSFEEVTVPRTWQKSSVFQLYADGECYKYSALSNAQETVLEKVGENVPSSAKSVVALFPANDASLVNSDGTLQIKLPAETSVGENEFVPESADLAVGSSGQLTGETTNLIAMNNICAYFRMDFMDSERILSVSIYGEGEPDLAGDLKVSLGEDGVPSVVSVENGVKKLTLTSENPLDGSYYIPVVPSAAPVNWHVDVVKVGGETVTDYMVTTTPVARTRNIAVRIKNELVPEYPVMSCTKAFWSDAEFTWTFGGDAESFDFYIDGELKTSLAATDNTCRIKNLKGGSTIKAKVVANVGTKKYESNEVEVVTGAIKQLTKNPSATSVAVAIDNMAGPVSGNFSPCIYVQIFDNADGTGTPVREAYIRDSEKQSQGTPFYSSLVVGGPDKVYPTSRIAIGGLKASTDYWVRVKSVASVTYTEYQSSSRGEVVMKSQNGESEYSELVKVSTSAAHVQAENEVIHEGFDDCIMAYDMVNCAVGLTPAYRGKTEDQSISGGKTPKNFFAWTEEWCFYGLRTGLPKADTYMSGWFTQQTSGSGSGTTAFDYQGTQCVATKLWIIKTSTGKYCAAPEFAVGRRVGSLKAASNSGFTTLVSNGQWLMTDSNYPAEGHMVIGQHFDTSDSEAPVNAGIVTPPLNSTLLSADAATCTISFKALALQGRVGNLTIYKLDNANNCGTSKVDVWEKIATIKIANSNGSTESDATEWSGYSETHKWYDYSQDVSLKKGDYIAFGSDGAAAICIDEISITTK